jgi:hypothetical protein
MTAQLSERPGRMWAAYRGPITLRTHSDCHDELLEQCSQPVLYSDNSYIRLVSQTPPETLANVDAQAEYHSRTIE